MRPIVAALLALQVALFVAATFDCAHGVDAIDPRATTPVDGNPCGNLGVVCLDMQGKESGYCCWEGETCGGGLYSVGCPAGQCCNVRMVPGGGRDAASGAIIVGTQRRVDAGGD